MTGLLVSVRSAEEARIALAAGVDVIDVKEPSRGSLGSADAATIRDVVDAVAGRITVSAACGELFEFAAACDAERSRQLPRDVDLAKIGLAGCRARADWRQVWRRWAAELPSPVRPVAVVYADRHAADSPPWPDVLSFASDAHSPYILVDTFSKHGATLFDVWTSGDLDAFVDSASAAHIGVVLAGSLRLADVPLARKFQPDFIAVRGAACRGGRDGVLDAAAIEQLLVALGRPPAGSRPMHRRQRIPAKEYPTAW
jgi:hypothetical protein